MSVHKEPKARPTRERVEKRKVSKRERPARKEAPVAAKGKAAQRQQRLFAGKRADETRVRIQGSIVVPTESLGELDFGDLLEIRVVARVKVGVEEMHDSGMVVREYVCKQEKAEVTPEPVTLEVDTPPVADDPNSIPPQD